MLQGSVSEWRNCTSWRFNLECFEYQVTSSIPTVVTDVKLKDNETYQYDGSPSPEVEPTSQSWCGPATNMLQTVSGAIYTPYAF
jgi:hypothetical protein